MISTTHPARAIGIAIRVAMLGLLATLFLIPAAQSANATDAAIAATGTVVDAATGDPIADAYVEASGDGYSDTTTDETGTYSLELQPGSYVFDVSAEGYEFYSGSVEINESMTTLPVIELSPLPDPVPVTGTVVDSETGDPVSNATVEAYDYNYGSGDTAVSDGTGAYVLNLRPGSTYSLYVSADGYESQQTTVDITESTTSLPVTELTAIVPGLHVFVSNSTTGGTAANAKLSLTPAGGGTAVVKTTDSDGHAVFEGLQAGSYGITVLSENDYVGGESEEIDYSGGYEEVYLSAEIDLRCEPSVVNPGLTNMGFEGGLNGWKLGYQTESIQVIGKDAFTSPWEGTSMARVGQSQASDGETQPEGPNVLCQDFKVTKATENFAFNVFTYDYTGFDQLRFDVIVTNPNTGETLAAYQQGAWGSGTALKTSGWRGVSLDLSGHIGQTVRLTFRAGGTSDDLYAFWAYVDSASTLPPTVNTSKVKVASTTGSVTTDPTTGQVMVAMPSGSPSDLTLTVPAKCQTQDETPESVRVLLDGEAFEAKPVGGGNFEATIPSESIVSGSLTLEVSCAGETTVVAPFGDVVLYDPSGVITDKSTGKPIEGATVRLFKVPGWTPRDESGPYPSNSCETNLSKSAGEPWSQAAPTNLGKEVNAASPEISPNVNPFITNSVGYYGWDVATGCWYVVVKKDGYETLTSPVVGVPSEVTDLNLKLTPVALAASKAPVISGTPKVGSKLSASTGTWNIEGSTLAYQWLRNGSPVSGATAATYQVRPSDVGATIRVRVTATKTGHAAGTATSAPVTALLGDAATATQKPTITGTAKVGKVLSATGGSWNPADVTRAYQWLANGTAISGATSSSYTPVAADAGKRISVRVTASKAGYANGVATSAATAPVNSVVVAATSGPSITGTAKVGMKLSTDGGSWNPADATKAYQWLRGGVAISGATASSYTLVAADRGKQVSVRVTASKAGYATATQTSMSRTVGFGTISCKVPVRSGKAKVGKKMTAKQSCTAAGTKAKFQWLRNGKVIKRATKATYKVTKSDKGKKITVRVTRTKVGYTKLVKTSKKSPKVR